MIPAQTPPASPATRRPSAAMIAIAAAPARTGTSRSAAGLVDTTAIARMVQALLGLTDTPTPDHASDALAVAVCHANAAPLAQALSGAGAR